MKKFVLLESFEFGNPEDEESLNLITKLLCRDRMDTPYTLSKAWFSLDKINYKRAVIKRRIYVISSGAIEAYGYIQNKHLRNGLKEPSFIGADRKIKREKATNIDKRKHYTAPDITFLIAEGKTDMPHTHFAVIPSSNHTISEENIKAIKERTGLLPLIFVFSAVEDLGHARCLGRKTGAKIIKPRKYQSFKNEISKCAFTVTEGLHGAIFSLLSHTPAYVDISNHHCRTFIGEVAARGGGRLIIPFSKRHTENIKDIEVCDGAFNKTLSIFKQELYSKLKELFI